MAGNETDTDVLVELTDASLEVADISSLNFEAGYRAEITETDKLPIVTLEFAGGLKDTPHDMTFAPQQNSLAVRRAVLDILGQIDLQQLCVSLEATAALMDIAYNACNGIVGAHQKLYELRMDIYKTTVRSVNLANEFFVVSKNILGGLIKVYGYIASGSSLKLKQVGTYLNRIAKLSKGMSEAAEKMAKDFEVLSDRTLKQGSEVVAVENDNIKLKQDMEAQLQDFKAQLEAFRVSKTELEKQIEQAQTLYTKYDDEARKLNEKADKQELIGTIMSGIGAVVGSIGSAFSGFCSSKESDSDIGGKGKEDDGHLDKEEDMPELEESDDVKTRQSRLGSNKAELEMIEERLKTYDQKISDLEKEKEEETEEEDTEKKSAVKKRTDEEIDKEIQDIKKKRDTDSARQETLKKQIAEDNSYLKGKRAAQVGLSVEEAGKKFGERFDNTSANARSAANAKEKLAEEILRLKFELQKKNSENEARIAEFTKKIKNMNLSTIDLSVAITSLQLAVTCLSTVGSIMANVSIFWNRVELSLKNLAGDETLATLQDIIQTSQGDPKEIAEYAMTDGGFIGDWYIMESKWFALQIVCEAYYMSCEKAKDRLDISLKRAETDGLEHWKLAQSMAAEMEEKLKISLRSSESKSKDYQEKICIMKKSREAAYKELME